MPVLYVTPLGILAVVAAAIGQTVIYRGQVGHARDRGMRPIAFNVVLLVNLASFLSVAFAVLTLSLPTLAVVAALFVGFILFQDQIMSAIAGPGGSASRHDHGSGPPEPTHDIRER